METLRLVLLFVHILGYAALLGGLLVQVRDDTKTVNSLMRDGSDEHLIGAWCAASDVDTHRRRTRTRALFAMGRTVTSGCWKTFAGR